MPEARLEIMPLIDVVFLLLTFFVFSLVLMIRADVLDIRVPALVAGDPAARANVITIGLDSAGALYVDGQSVSSDQLVSHIRDAQLRSPDAKLLVAADVRTTSGALLNLIDQLVDAGLGEFSLVSSPAE